MKLDFFTLIQLDYLLKNLSHSPMKLVFLFNNQIATGDFFVSNKKDISNSLIEKIELEKSRAVSAHYQSVTFSNDLDLLNYAVNFVKDLPKDKEIHQNVIYNVQIENKNYDFLISNSSELILIGLKPVNDDCPSTTA